MIEAIAKGVICAAIWIALAAAIFRGAVPFLWGSASDFGMLAAVVVGAFGLAGLLLLGNRMIDGLVADLSKEDQ